MKPATAIRQQDGQGGRHGAGLAARKVAADVVAGALSGRRTLDAALDAEFGTSGLAGLDARDRAFVKLLSTETLRRLGQIREALSRFMHRKPPRSAGSFDAVLAISACQILFLETPAHAAVDQAVRLMERDRQARRYKGLANAVLRRMAENREAILAEQDAPRLNLPGWLRTRWEAAYGAETARAIAAAQLVHPPLDLSLKADADSWADKLGGRVLPTGSIRLETPGAVTGLEGYGEGAWWVQDAAAALPARLLGDIAGLRVADLCAAPGGKTAQLAAAGAQVTAVEVSPGRMKRLKSNLTRLGLTAEFIEADAAEWRPDAPFDAILLDAPCSATGTLRRHPDIAWTRSAADVKAMAKVQARLLDAALDMVRPGGIVVFATCSLEPEEGEAVVRPALEAGGAERVPIAPQEIGGLEACINPDGDLRTLPCHDPGAPGGMDGFFATRLRRSL